MASSEWNRVTRHLFAIRVLDLLVLGERPQARTNTCDHQVGTYDAHFPERVNALADDLL